MNSSAAPLAREPDDLPEIKYDPEEPDEPAPDPNEIACFSPEPYDPRDASPGTRADSAIREKWGWKTMTAGFTAVPNTLLMMMGKQGCTPLEFTVLVQLMRYWWKPDEWPYPSVARLAEDIGVCDKTVRRALAGLAKSRIIQRIERRHDHDRSQTNLYSLAPLVTILEWETVKRTADADLKRACMLFPGDPIFFWGRFEELSEEDQDDAYEALQQMRAARQILSIERP